jgi:hypothetical protein
MPHLKDLQHWNSIEFNSKTKRRIKVKFKDTLIKILEFDSIVLKTDFQGMFVQYVCRLLNDE